MPEKDNGKKLGVMRLRISGKARRVFRIIEHMAHFKRLACMERRCSWCGSLLGYKDGSIAVTHGICKECADKELRKIEPANERKEESIAKASNCPWRVPKPGTCQDSTGDYSGPSTRSL